MQAQKSSNAGEDRGDEQAGRYVEADALVNDAAAGVKHALEWVKK